MTRQHEKYPLDAAWDRHIIDRDRYLAITSNVMIRLQLRGALGYQCVARAVGRWTRLHPYLHSRLREKSDGTSWRGWLEPLSGALSLHAAHTISAAGVIGDRLHQRIKLRVGPLLLLGFCATDDGGQLEMTMSHALGDGMSALYLCADLLALLDDPDGSTFVSSIAGRPAPCATDYSSEAAVPVAPIFNMNTLPGAALEDDGPDDWQMRALDLGRYAALSDWLQRRNICAAPEDLIHWHIQRAATDAGEPAPTPAVIQSYRELLAPALRRRTANEALFSRIAVPSVTAVPQREWLEDFHRRRRQSVSIARVLAQRQFILALNQALADGRGVSAARQTLRALQRGNVFATNNYGDIDRCFPQTRHITLQWLDIQDAAPNDELRFWSLGGKLYANLSGNARRIALWSDALRRLEATSTT